MTSNPQQPTPEWPTSGPASSEPLEGLPLAEDGFPVPDGRWHTGPLDPWQTGPQGRVRAGGRWPTTRAPWPGPAGGRGRGGLRGPPGRLLRDPGVALRPHPALAIPEDRRPAAGRTAAGRPAVARRISP